jgi:hypothetical protein
MANGNRFTTNETGGWSTESYGKAAITSPSHKRIDKLGANTPDEDDITVDEIEIIYDASTLITSQRNGSPLSAVYPGVDNRVIFS